ncbi:MAG TPA: hypothetical protein VJ598_01400 [Albitalea sp.]|nr:hypothetical protein [Albitalea sp.]
MPDHPTQVGAPDPELDTSPILDGDETLELEPHVEGAACRFNGVTYGIGDYVLSGAEVLRCEAPGVWVRSSEMRPKIEQLF